MRVVASKVKQKYRKRKHKEIKDGGVLLLCYKDMTFCDSDCVNTQCFRNFSPEQKAGATAWWGNATAPVAFSSGFKEGCNEYKAQEETKEINNAVA